MMWGSESAMTLRMDGRGQTLTGEGGEAACDGIHEEQPGEDAQSEDEGSDMGAQQVARQDAHQVFGRPVSR